MLVCGLLMANASNSQVNADVKKVYVVFKTHLDVGFTDLSSVVEKRYLEEFIPKALDVADRLRSEDGEERYVWTTGSWLIWNYLQSAPAPEVRRLEDAIRHGDIVWNGVPYTVESEIMNRDLFETNLLISRRLDERFGKHTIAAKMTDVPGHTRGVVGPFSRAGIEFLHVGVNPASQIPSVPQFCRWRDADGHEIILGYQRDYGSEDLLPDGKTVLSVNFTGDNHGPHSYDDVKSIYSGLHVRYPNAELVAASFNEVAEELMSYREQLPVITSEIGDTWIHGYGGSPIRMAKFRALSNLYSGWLKEGRLDRYSDESINFALELGLIAEHTQGMDVKTHLCNWDKYDMDEFVGALGTEPFVKIAQSWKEIDDYLGESVKYLPPELQAEAADALSRIDVPSVPDISGASPCRGDEIWTIPLIGGKLNIGGVTYRMYDSHDYDEFLDNYLRSRADWALCDFGKPGLSESDAVGTVLTARTLSTKSRTESNGLRHISELVFPADSNVDGRVYPEKIYVNTLSYNGGRKAEVELTIVNKPAVRLPESYWLSFNADGIESVVAEKTGSMVDLFDVVEHGNRQMHGIDRYVDVVTSGGTYRIWSETAFLVSVGEPRGLNYSTDYPNKDGGVHFNLSNNLWGTNFSMWNEGSLTYRFTVELL